MAGTYPNNPNIFVPADVADGYDTLPLNVVRGIREGLLDNYLAHSDTNNNEVLYARTIVGSQELESFYAGLLQSYKYHALTQSDAERQPLAIIHESQVMLLGLCVSMGVSNPRELHVAQNEDAFNLNILIAEDRDTYYRIDNFADTQVSAVQAPEWKVIGTGLESTRWHAGENNVAVERRYCQAVAVGRNAVEALPQFEMLANTYDQLLDQSRQPV